MPMKCGRVCSCGKVVPSDTLCACQRQRKREYDRARPSPAESGYDSKWRKARAAFLQKHSVCVLCPEPATVVNHKRPHRGDKKLFWDSKNWEPACKRCHDGPIKRREYRCYGR